MDSNKANVGTFYLTIPILILTAVAVGFMAYDQIYTPRAQTAPIESGGSSMSGWLPIIIIASLLALAVTLQVFLGLRLRKNKHLRSELATVTSDAHRNENLWNEAKQETQSMVRKLELGHQREIDSLNKKLDERIEELKTSQREAEAQRNRADSEVHDKSLVRELKSRAEAELADLAFLKELAKQQASDLSTYVRTEILTHPHCGELQLTGKHLCILLGVSIQNESVFDIAIEEKQITGQFSLDRVAFREQAGQLIDDFRPPLHDLKPRQRETILIEQPLLAFEAEKIERFLADDPDAKFSIGALGIPISINNAGFPATNAPFLRFRGGEVPLKYFKRNTDIG